MWVRVSTGGQDEAQQVPAVEGHCDQHGYTIAKRYELNDRSASKGEQQAKLDEMLADMRDGTIKVLVCWRSNRLERRGPEALFRLLRQVKDAGGRIESTTEPMLGTEDLSGEALTALGAVMDKQFSAKLSEDTLRAITNIKASGHVYNGNVPWGFEVEGPKYEKTMAPTDLCRQYVPQIFERCIKGKSLRTMAAWLDAEHVPTKRGGKWNEGSVRWIIRNRAYVEYGIIRPSIYDRANAALKNHPKRGPAKNPPMLANLRCARCADKGIDSPMYRIPASRGSGRKLFYRCTGRGPQRKGCGNMVPLEATDQIVVFVSFVSNTRPYRTQQWVEGQNWDDEISNAKQDLREAVDAERWADLPALTAKVDELRSRESVPGHYEYADTGKTIHEHFLELDDEGRREFLAQSDIRVEKAFAADGSKGVHVIVDGEDYGVIVLNIAASSKSVENLQAIRRFEPCAAMRILAETALPQGSPVPGQSILGVLKGFSPPSAVPQSRPCRPALSPAAVVPAPQPRPM